MNSSDPLLTVPTCSGWKAVRCEDIDTLLDFAGCARNRNNLLLPERFGMKEAPNTKAADFLSPTYWLLMENNE